MIGTPRQEPGWAAEWRRWLALALLLMPGCVAAAASAPTNTVPDLFPLRRIEWLPAAHTPVFRPLAFPLGWPVERVDRLATAGGRVWIAARRRGATNSAGSRLWVFSQADGRIDQVGGRVDQHAVREVRPGGEGLWLALDGGVASLDPRTFRVEPFGPMEGLTSGTPIGFGGAARRWFTLTEAGALFVLNGDGRAWSRLPGPVGGGGRRPVRLETMQGSGDWLLALGPGELLLRHHAASEWTPVDERQWKTVGWREIPEWRCAVEDGDGGFWIGSNLGLHFLVGETGSMVHQPWKPSITVAGGLGVAVPQGYRPSAAAFVAARMRQAAEIRERMKLRVQAAKATKELGVAVDPVTPVTRLPGPVSALARDGAFTWVACREGTNSARSRVLLWHGPSRRWVAHFGMGLPVTCMASDESGLWLGTDLSAVAAGAPVLLVDKRPMMAVPAVRWVADEILPAELGTKLAGLPVRERAVHAFFAGEAAKVVELLEASPEDPESLFLQAFANDSVGLDRKERREVLLDRLMERYPETAFGELIRSIRPVTASKPGGPGGGASAVLAGLFKRRDADGDGRISAAEWEEWRGKESPMAPWDRNGDGGLDLDEFDLVLRGGE